ncbi:18302_t:CDS:1, partial [Racocetra persica]
KVKNARNAIYRQNGPSFGMIDLKLSPQDNEGRTWICCKADYEKLIRHEPGTFQVQEYEVFQYLKN